MFIAASPIETHNFDTRCSSMCFVLFYSCTANEGSLEFSGNWVTFLDSLSHLFLIQDLPSDFLVPVRIAKVEINPKYIMESEQAGEYAQRY